VGMYITATIATVATAALVGEDIGDTSLASDVAAELAKVPKSDSTVTWNATALGSIQAEANDALIANNLDHLALTATIAADMTAEVADNTILARVLSSGDTSAFIPSTDALNKIKAAVVAGVATALQSSANVETTGTLVGGDFASTYLSNGVYYITAPVTPAVGGFGLNAYLKFAAGTGQYINSVTIRGHFNAGAGRYCNVYAYNYTGTPGWDQLSDSGTRMNNATSNSTYTYTLLSAHQKPDAGGDGVGGVRIGFMSPSITTGDRLNIDQCVVNVATAGASAADIADAVYARMRLTVYDSAVWVDTVNGVDGYDVGVHGLVTTPVKTMAAAYSLCAALNIKRVHFKAGSNVTPVALTQSAASWRFIGPAVIDVAGFSIADAAFEGCYTVSNTAGAVGDDVEFTDCGIGDGPFRHAYFIGCRLKNATGITLTAGDEYHFINCVDTTPDVGDPATFTFAAGAVLNLRNYRGGVKIKNMKAGDHFKLDGYWRLVIHTDCTGGDVTLRGFGEDPTGCAAFTTLPNTGAVTEGARFALDNPPAWNAAWDAEAQSEANDALVALKLDHLVAVADADDVVNDSIVAKLASKSATADWSGFVNTTDSLEAISDVANTSIYTAKIWVVDDNGAGVDRYSCVWFKDGIPVVAGITLPTLQVIKSADGTDLVASETMTQSGATGLYYDNQAVARMVSGVAYIAKCTATIDTATRTSFQPVSRDSTV
jgi:hypothetical protein